MSFPGLSLQDAVPEVQKFLDDNVEQWADQTIAESMRAVARAANMSENYIGSIKVRKTGFATVKIFSDHPHAKKIEFGTKAHPITTKGGPESRSPPTKLKFPGRIGAISTDVFRPIVHHPGTRPKLILTKGWELGLPLFKNLASQEKQKFEESLK